MSPHRRGPWSNSEDSYLMQLVQTHGPLNWVRIAQTLGSRSPKQCRERYHQNLKPTLNHDPITPEEGAQIERLVHEIGKRWAEIARRLHGRSDNAVKNWWNGSQNRKKRLSRRHVVQTTATLSNDSYCRPPPLSMVVPSLPQPTSPHRPRQQVPWVEPPLPSPCSSESAESDAGSNYTTSPARHSFSLHAAVELPPLRTGLDVAGTSGSTDSRLPSLMSLTSPMFGGQVDTRPRLPPLATGSQLPTAPSSPKQQHEQQRSPTTGLADRDSRMNLSTLLG